MLRSPLSRLTCLPRLWSFRPRGTSLLAARCCIAILLALAPVVCRGAAIEGRVYLDVNHNARLDQGEAGVAGVLVSDGRHVTATDGKGCYRLETDEPRVLLWISVPRDHRPSGAFWRWSDGQRAENFGLVRRLQPADFCFLQITDTHIGRDDLLRAFAKHVSELPAPIAFVVNTGDLVGDANPVAGAKARQQYDRYMGAAAAFTKPLFNVPGNHEHVAIGVKNADKTDPLYGKGMYRQLLGPMHYSWDWGDVHFVALDGTSLPYQEKLGAEQLAWLKADLSFQPKGKRLVLFCHQSAPKLRDAKELGGILHDRNVLGIFCGHLHSTFTTQLENIPVYHTGALCGAWWSGPNLDGTPQGFRLVQIKSGRLKTAYSNREGRWPLYVASPSASSVQSGKVDIEVVVLDFGKRLELTTQYADHSAPLKLASREELWSTWKGTVDTTKAYDGDRVVRVSSRAGDALSTCDVRYVVVNGRPEPYRADAPATLKFEVRGLRGASEVLLNGKPLGTIPADTPNGTTLSFDIPRDRLTKVVQVTVRAGARQNVIRVGPIWLEYKKKELHDLRYASFDRQSISGVPTAFAEPKKDWYFCLPERVAPPAAAKIKR